MEELAVEAVFAADTGAKFQPRASSSGFNARVYVYFYIYLYIHVFYFIFLFYFNFKA